MTGAPGENTYEIHLDYESLVSLFLRIMQNNDTAERSRALSDVMLVLSYLVTPTQCYHVAIENEFEYCTIDNKTGCGQLCSFCRGDVGNLAGRINKKFLISFLTKTFSAGKSPPSPGDLIKMIKTQRAKVFTDDDKNTKTTTRTAET